MRNLMVGVACALALHAVCDAATQATPGLNETIDRRTIDRGRYLVKIAGCNDCHTEKYASKAGAVAEREWLTGDTVGSQGPWGTTYPANLRLVIANLTEAQWMTAARQPRRPPMPWFALRDMTDSDVRAIYRFVRSLGPAGAPAPAYVPPGGLVTTRFVISEPPHPAQKR